MVDSEIAGRNTIDSNSMNDENSSKDDDSIDSRSSSNNSNNNISDEENSNVEDPIFEYDYEYSVTTPQHDDKDYQPLSSKQRERIQNIEVASKNVLAVIQKYGKASLPSLDHPNDYKKGSSDCWRISNDSAWANTSLAMREIVNAREGMIKAWDNDEEDASQANHDVVGIKTQKGERNNNDDDNKWWKSIIVTDDDSRMEGTAKGRRCTIANMNTYSEEVVNEEGEEALTGEEERQFHTVHMEWATNAFAEELEALRNGQPTIRRQQQQKGMNTKSTKEEQNELHAELDPTQYSFVVAKPMENEKDDTINNNDVGESNIDVQILADIMQSGSNVLSTTEKKMLLNARNRALVRKREEGYNNSDGDANKLTMHKRRKRELGFLC